MSLAVVSYSTHSTTENTKVSKMWLISQWASHKVLYSLKLDQKLWRGELALTQLKLPKIPNRVCLWRGHSEFNNQISKPLLCFQLNLPGRHGEHESHDCISLFCFGMKRWFCLLTVMTRERTLVWQPLWAVWGQANYKTDLTERILTCQHNKWIAIMGQHWWIGFAQNSTTHSALWRQWTFIIDD